MPLDHRFFAIVRAEARAYAGLFEAAGIKFKKNSVRKVVAAVDAGRNTGESQGERARGVIKRDPKAASTPPLRLEGRSTRDDRNSKIAR
jgi:hypothetical protein